MRVLHVASMIDSAGGGPAVALHGLARAQKQSGLDVRIVCTYRAGEKLDAAAALRDAGVDVIALGPGKTPLQLHPQIAPELRKHTKDCDVLHIHAIWEEVQHRAARIALETGVPYIIRPCGMLDPWSLSQSRLRKKIYLALRLRGDLQHAAALHFTSQTERDLVAPLKLDTRAIVEPNGIDLSEFADLPPAGTFRARDPRLQNRPMVLFLSRIHHKKGLDILIPAFAESAPKEAMLVLAGPDADGYQAEIVKLIDRHGISDRVIWTGMLRGADRIAALRDADLFVLPSYQENFGIAVVEALAAGTAVLISDQVNIWREIVDAGVGGVCQTNVPALAEQLRLWISDTPRRQAAAAAARQYCFQHYDWRQIAARWSDHYRGLKNR